MHGNCVMKQRMLLWCPAGDEHLMHGMRDLAAAMETLYQAAKQAGVASLRRCQQLRSHDPTARCRLLEILVKPSLCKDNKACSIAGGKAKLAKLERRHRLALSQCFLVSE